MRHSDVGVKHIRCLFILMFVLCSAMPACAQPIDHLRASSRFGIAQTISAVVSGDWSAYRYASGHPSGLWVLGYLRASGPGGGLLMAVRSCTPDGGTCFRDSVGNYFHRVLDGPVYATQFGADETGATDSQAALQNFVNYVAIPDRGREGIIGCGTFRHRGSLTIPRSQGWTINGTSRLCTKLVEDADNTPQFKFVGNMTWGWDIGNFHALWRRQQTGRDTDSDVFLFTGNGANYFDGRIHGVSASKGFRTISNDCHESPLFWQIEIHNMVHARDMTGGFINTCQAVSTGQPSTIIENVKIYANAMVPSESAIRLNTCNNCVLATVEVNGVKNGNTVFNFGSSSITGWTWKIGEGTVYKSVPRGKGSIIFCNNGTITVQRVHLDINRVNVAGRKIYGFGGGRACTITVQTVHDTTHVRAGAFFIVKVGPTSRFIATNVLGLPAGSHDHALTDLASDGSADRTRVIGWEGNASSRDLGDADAVWIPGVSPPVLSFNTALTRDRTVKIADSFNLFNGYGPTVVRNAPIPGGFTLSIIDPEGRVLAVIPKSRNGMRQLAYSGHRWHLMRKEDWTAKGR